MAVDMIHHVERRFDIIFTDYTFQMLAEYIAIALFRVDVEKQQAGFQQILSFCIRRESL